MIEKELLSLLRCPNTKDSLIYKDEELYSSSTSYPIINNIPWLFKEPELEFLSWSTKIANYISEEESSVATLKTIVGLEKNKLTHLRLSKLLSGKIKNLDQFKTCLEVFNGQQPIHVDSTTQQIHSYFKLLFRDWCWGDEELSTHIEYINDNIDFTDKRVLVLGSGACGLSFKLASQNLNATFFNIEHNPYLAFMANDIIEGKSFSLAEYNPYSINLDQTLKDREISSKLKLSNNHIILSSFPNLPFDHASFDIVLAPWFLDILDDEFSVSLQAAKNFLKPEGTFLFCGPANIHKNDYIEQFSSDEIIANFKSEFSTVNSSQSFVPYLNSPIDSQKRTESVLFVCASKPKLSEAIQAQSSINKKEHINYSDEFKQYKLINDTFHRILQHINGDISYSELATKLEAEFGFTKKESLHYARTFIKKINFEIYRS